jgi:hypothetical protein
MHGPIRKICKTKRAGGVADMVEYLPGKHKSLSSNPISLSPQKEIAIGDL